MSDTKHAPTPYAVYDRLKQPGHYQNGGLAAFKDGKAFELWGGYDGEMADRTTLDFIVRACNHHDELVAALTKTAALIHPVVGCRTDVGFDGCDCLPDVRRLLARIEAQ